MRIIIRTVHRLILGDEIKAGEIGEVRNILGRDEKHTQHFENWREQTTWETQII
jgi:hypothetical protein